jgi:hypothetical protein
VVAAHPTWFFNVIRELMVATQPTIALRAKLIRLTVFWQNKPIFFR